MRRCTPSGSVARSVSTCDASSCLSIRLHDLRHGWATMALGAGVHPKVVQERLGHANISITLDTYSHVTAGLHEDAAAKVAGLFFGS